MHTALIVGALLISPLAAAEDLTNEDLCGQWSDARIGDEVAARRGSDVRLEPQLRQELARRNLFSAATWKRIEKGAIWIGMPRAALYCSRGFPDRINRTVTQTSAIEQFVYGDLLVYVEDGRVTTFQDSY